MDRVVSSYTPTIRALQYARQHLPDPEEPAHALIVAMPTTSGLPGAGPLPRFSTRSTREGHSCLVRCSSPIQEPSAVNWRGRSRARQPEPTCSSICLNAPRPFCLPRRQRPHRPLQELVPDSLAVLQESEPRGARSMQCQRMTLHKVVQRLAVPGQARQPRDAWTGSYALPENSVPSVPTLYSWVTNRDLVRPQLSPLGTSHVSYLCPS
jgi:hypothetical protein